MGRIIGGILAGVVAALATVWCIDLLGHLVYPVPSDLNLRDFEAVGQYIRSMPTGALAIVALAWFAGALVGGLVAAAIARRDWAVWPVAGLVAAAGVLNILLIPHPTLLQIGAVVAPLAGGLVARHFARGRGWTEPA